MNLHGNELGKGKRFGASLLLIMAAYLLYGCDQGSDTRAQAQASDEQVVAKVSSVPLSEVLGKQYLSDRFLQGIENIKLNPRWAQSTEGMVYIPGGKFDMGADLLEGFEDMEPSARAQPDEYPKHEVELRGFYMDEHEVTVREYMEFVRATGYKTVAEYDVDWEEMKKQLPEGTPKPSADKLRAGALVFHYVPEETSRDRLDNWWSFVHGAYWKNPSGKDSVVENFLDHPVTQISWYDAMAYAKWKGKRLPTEAEYEYAMRGGAASTMYPWGNQKVQDNEKLGNFLQGDFPYTNSGQDGFMGTAPVKSFPPNAYGLYDISGNVWEWTMDWYSAHYYKNLKDTEKTAINPKGPVKTEEIYENYSTNKVVRGGSFLCNDSWCSGYRNSRRMRLSPDTGMEHLGFRCVKDVDLKK